MKSVLLPLVLACTASGLNAQLTALPLTAPTPAAPTLQTQSLALGGSMQGLLNLPAHDADGFLSGNLSLGGPAWLMVAELPAASVSVGATGLLGGSLNGALFALPLEPAVDAVVVVSGSWSWSPATGAGSLSASLLIEGPPGSSPLLFPIGQLHGSFVDLLPDAPGGRDPLGAFAGTWQFFLQVLPAPLPDGDPYPGPGGRGDS